MPRGGARPGQGRKPKLTLEQCVMIVGEYKLRKMRYLQCKTLEQANKPTKMKKANENLEKMYPAQLEGKLIGRRTAQSRMSDGSLCPQCKSQSISRLNGSALAKYNKTVRKNDEGYNAGHNPNAFLCKDCGKQFELEMGECFSQCEGFSCHYLKNESCVQELILIGAQALIDRREYLNNRKTGRLIAGTSVGGGARKRLIEEVATWATTEFNSDVSSNYVASLLKGDMRNPHAKTLKELGLL